MSSRGDGKAEATAKGDGPPKDDKNRGGARNRFRQKGKKKPQVSRNAARDEGECEDLYGSIYDSPDGRNPDQYVKTTKVIARYLARKYKDGGSIRTAAEQLKAAVVVAPTELSSAQTETDKMIFSIKYSSYAKQKRTVQQEVEALYSLVWGQCTNTMRQRLEALPGQQHSRESRRK
jgi:hypothetical protein